MLLALQGPFRYIQSFLHRALLQLSIAAEKRVAITSSASVRKLALPHCIHMNHSVVAAIDMNIQYKFVMISVVVNANYVGNNKMRIRDRVDMTIAIVTV